MTVAIEDAGFQIRDCIAWMYGSGFPKSHNIGNGIGTALKPAFEPIVMGRKPFKGTVKDNVLTYGVGGLNIDDSRIEYSADDHVMKYDGYKNGEYKSEYTKGTSYTYSNQVQINPNGRWPANVILDEEAGKLLDEQNDASRFFYCPKANKKDRGDNSHPTIKPTQLMEYLIKLVTPKGGIVLDPFMGSGSTGKGAVLNDYSFVGIELSPEYFAIAESRINAVKDKTKFWC
jgi:site-specific DNA-methyltransferase (adenine-specific)